MMLLQLLVLATTAVAQQNMDRAVMAGYDLVAYHQINARDDGVPGKPSISARHGGFLYYFNSTGNRDAFLAEPEKYLPAYGGFCAWGIAYEYPEDNWPWAADHMGPPCGPRDGWAILDGILYCSIWRSYQDDFNLKSAEAIPLANERWKGFYGSLSGGPMNNGCYAWNWQSCYRTSIYNPALEFKNPPADGPATVSFSANTGVSRVPLFDVEPTIVWSDYYSVLGDTVQFRFTLADLTTSDPQLVVELSALDGSAAADSGWIGFGIAEALMQGALVACNRGSLDVSQQERDLQATTTECRAIFGAGMGTFFPETDPVKPTVLSSIRNETHTTIQFTANLFGCWSDPKRPARLLFAVGESSGSGDPQPHLNDELHRQTIDDVDLLSVVTSADLERSEAPKLKEIAPLPPKSSWSAVEGRSGSLNVLEDRFVVSYQLNKAQGDEDLITVRIEQRDAKRDQYVAFGFAKEIMSGLIMSCTPRFDDGAVSAVCHQWRGEGTNIYPLAVTEDAGGWVLTGVSGDEDSVEYELTGRLQQVANDLGGTSTTRTIIATGRSTSDTGVPLIHAAKDRTSMQFDLLRGSDLSFGTSGGLVHCIFPVLLLFALLA